MVPRRSRHVFEGSGVTLTGVSAPDERSTDGRWPWHLRFSRRVFHRLVSCPGLRRVAGDLRHGAVIDPGDEVVCHLATAMPAHPSHFLSGNELDTPHLMSALSLLSSMSGVWGAAIDTTLNVVPVTTAGVDHPAKVADQGSSTTQLPVSSPVARSTRRRFPAMNTAVWSRSCRMR